MVSSLFGSADADWLKTPLLKCSVLLDMFTVLFRRSCADDLISPRDSGGFKIMASREPSRSLKTHFLELYYCKICSKNLIFLQFPQ